MRKASCCLAAAFALCLAAPEPSLGADARIDVTPQSVAAPKDREALAARLASLIASCSGFSVVLDDGRYTSLQFVLDLGARPKGCAARFDIKAKHRQKAVLDGAGAEYAIAIKNAATAPVSIRGLHFTNYSNVISATAPKDATGSASAAATKPDLIIRDNLFTNIGDVRKSETGPVRGWGAIVLTGVSNAVIARNAFFRIGNDRQSELLHSIYLKKSSGNRIRRNTFSVMEGVALKLRDASNKNIIARNVFVLGKTPIYQDWFCNADINKKSCPVAESPSKDNAFRNNVLVDYDARYYKPRGGFATPAKTHPFVWYVALSGHSAFEMFYARPARSQLFDAACGAVCRLKIRGNVIVRDRDGN